MGRADHARRRDAGSIVTFGKSERVRPRLSSGYVMTYFDQWRVLSNRIRGLVQAGQLHAQWAYRSSDSYGTAKALLQQTRSIFLALESFLAAFRGSLPALPRARSRTSHNVTVVS